MDLLVVPNEGLQASMEEAIGFAPASTPWRLRFFSNDYTPGPTSVAADFTPVTMTVLFVPGTIIEIVLDPALWVFSIIAADPPDIPLPFAQALYPAQTVPFNGPVDSPGTIYGYYMLDNVDRVRIAQRYADEIVPFIPIQTGDATVVTPRWTGEPTPQA